MRLAALALTVTAIFVPLSRAAAFAVTTRCVVGKPCYGTKIDDRLTGTDGDYEILALGGRDFVDASGSSNVVHGGSGADGDEYVARGLYGDSPGMSVNSGRDGDDRIYSWEGRDTLYGFGGFDLLGGDTNHIFAEEYRSRLGYPGVARSKNPSVDSVSGGGGGDRIEAVDGHRDVTDCGGKDAVWFDKGLDKVSADCELRNILHSGG